MAQNQSPQPQIFSDDDLMFPVFCIKCRVQVPGITSTANNGLCASCVQSKNIPPPQIIPPVIVPPQKSQQMNPVHLTLILSALALFIIFTSLVSMSNARKEEAARQQAEAEIQRQKEIEYNSPYEVAKREREAENARREAIEIAARGAKPIPSEWDGITPEVNSYLQRNLKDYDSMKIVECSPVVTWGTDAWAQRVKYRARNSFGAYVLDNKVFVIKNGYVIDYMDY
jgi:type II secretory pathway pseudopilin PulG